MNKLHLLQCAAKCEALQRGLDDFRAYLRSESVLQTGLVSVVEITRWLDCITQDARDASEAVREAA